MKMISLVIVGSMLVAGCTSEKQFKKKVEAALANDPGMIVRAIERNPTQILIALQHASQKAQETAAKEKEELEKKALADSFDNPLKVTLRPDESIVGPKDAPITLVEYSDFECPYCARSFNTVKNLMDMYKGKIRFVYKHLPLSFHPQAMISAKYYEAIRLQDEKKAFAFHDEVYQDQRKLSNGVPFLNQMAKKVGADLVRLKRDTASELISKRIEEDVAEANKLGIQGTPGFLINGVPVRGAYPTEHFVAILNELQKRGKLKL